MAISNLMNYVYIVRAGDLYKIGNARDLDRRLMQLRTASPFLEKVLTIRCLAHRAIEQQLHLLFAHKREAGEWFSLDEQDLDFIATMDYASLPVERAARMKLEDLSQRVIREFKALPIEDRQRLKSALVA